MTTLRQHCILDLDSPSYPPVDDEYRQCGCLSCRQYLDTLQKSAMTTDDPEQPWSSWYADARREMEFRYGLRRIPKDHYKEQYALGSTPQQAAKAIYQEMQSRGKL